MVEFETFHEYSFFPFSVGTNMSDPMTLTLESALIFKKDFNLLITFEQPVLLQLTSSLLQ